MPNCPFTPVPNVPFALGFQIHLYFQLFDVAMVLVYAFSFIAVMLAVEWLVLQPWERRVRRWRD